MLAVAIGLVVFVIGEFIGLSRRSSIVFAIGIIVANVPEGLLPTVTLAMAMAARRMARRQTLVRHLPSVETLGSRTVICTDKTGTLTQNRMEVRTIYVPARSSTLRDASRRRVRGRASPLLRVRRILPRLEGGAAQTASQRWLGDPMEMALVTDGCSRARRRAGARPHRRDPLRTRAQAARHACTATPDEVVLFVKGAPEERAAARALD